MCRISDFYLYSGTPFILVPENQYKRMNNRKGIISLSPLILFVTLYLSLSVVANDFYKVPVAVMFIISSVYAVAISGHGTLKNRIGTFCHGAGNKDIMMMICIFILAGAFANSAKEMGCIDATVGITLDILPGNMLFAGLFITACFISLSVGTSVGTIVALTPIATGIATSTGADVPFVVAIIAGGAFFGDNLSFISDTTIMATSTQGCRMSDKFLVNSLTAIPVAIAVLTIYIIQGYGMRSPDVTTGIQYIKVLPYLFILITAVCGMNVMAILMLGTLLTGIIGICDGSYTLMSWLKAIDTGIGNMGELIVITLLAGGMLEIICRNGGIDYIIERITRHISNKRGTELAIAALVCMVNVCTANNTVAILTVGGIAKSAGDSRGVDRRKCASILDTFSCCTQGLLPYGAQLLIASGLAGLTPIAILPHMYYPMALLIASVVAIVIRYPRKYS